MFWTNWLVKFKTTANMDSMENQFMDAVRHANMDVIKNLLKKGCKVDIGDTDNLTPLHLAAMKDHHEIALLLIQKGANVNRKTADKMAPLHYAAVRGLAEMVELLIEKGATLDSLDANERTPLYMAVARNHEDVVDVLIKYKAKVNIEEIHGYTPLCEAVWNKSVDIARALLKSGAKLTQSQHLLHYTVLHRHLAMAELLLEYGAYPNLRDDHGDTPLIMAISCVHIDMIRLLLQYGASPNCANTVNGVTPLHQALSSATTPEKFNEILRLLCLYDVDLNQQAVGTYLTPLASAIMCGKMINAVSLIRAGANVNKPSDLVMCEPLERANKIPIQLEWTLDDEFGAMAYLLVAAGYDLSTYTVEYPKDFSKVDTDTLDGWLVHMKYNPRRLTDLCRLTIRDYLGPRLLQTVPKLEIPYSLKQYLLLEDVCRNVRSDLGTLGLTKLLEYELADHIQIN